MTLERTHRPDLERAPEPAQPSTRELPADKPAELGHLDRLWQTKASAPGDGGQTTSPSEGQPHRAASDGASAETGSAQTINDLLKIVTHSFHWFNSAAQRRVAQLREDLKKEDKPAWFAQLAEAALAVALGAGAAAAGARLAAQFAPAAGEVGTEFVKMMWEGGITAGIDAGRATLGDSGATTVLDRFIASQQKGIEVAQIANLERFVLTDSHQIKTVAEAWKLKTACSQVNIHAAADMQYEATRNAWVSYLAQARYGAVGKRGAVTRGDVDVGPTTTNMSTQDRRDQTNRWAPGFVPADAPDLGDALRNEAPGVLVIVAKLPTIFNHVMIGKPTVKMAFLNGVNDTIRRQYERVPLAAMSIPRQIVAKVDGAPDFTLNLDERGQSNSLKPEQRTWLAARATVGHPENATKDEWERSQEGMKKLLAELVPRSIKRSMW